VQASAESLAELDVVRFPVAEDIERRAGFQGLEHGHQAFVRGRVPVADFPDESFLINFALQMLDRPTGLVGKLLGRVVEAFRELFREGQKVLPHDAGGGQPLAHAPSSESRRSSPETESGQNR
jgi:hypothetical protein